MTPRDLFALADLTPTLPDTPARLSADLFALAERTEAGAAPAAPTIVVTLPSLTLVPTNRRTRAAAEAPAPTRLPPPSPGPAETTAPAEFREDADPERVPDETEPGESIAPETPTAPAPHEAETRATDAAASPDASALEAIPEDAAPAPSNAVDLDTLTPPVARDARPHVAAPRNAVDLDAPTPPAAITREAESHGAAPREPIPLDPALLDPSAPLRRREHDHRLDPEDNIAPTSLRDRAARNLAALRLLKQLEAEARPATPDERDTLARYSGWGALSRVFDRYPGEWKDTAEELRALVTEEEWEALSASTPNAHYTSLAVVDAMWRGVERLGLPEDARVLEPALGIGHFFGLQPDRIHGPRTGVELESLSARLARALYPDSVIHAGAFEAYPHLGGYDLVIGNVPFGRYGVRDAHYRAQPVVTRAIHDYFIGRALDEVRPGGLVALITSRYTLDKVNTAFRRWADERANLVGALRLPSGAFERSAGTEVVTDILFLQRRFEGAGRGAEWVDVGTFEDDTWREPMNTYFLDHPERILGTPHLGHGLYGSSELRVEGDLDPTRLRAAIERLPEGIVPPREGRHTQVPVPDASRAPASAKTGALILHEGQLHRVEQGRLTPVRETGVKLERLRGIVEIRDTAQHLLAAQLDDAPDADIEALRADLNRHYDAFSRRFGPLSARTNAVAFRDDPASGLLLALEEGYDREANTARKTALFSRRTLRPYVPPTHTDDAAQALSITLGETGRVHWPRLVELVGKPATEIAAELGDLIYEDPATREWLTREEYLSGDVRLKLDQARVAAAGEPVFERNILALQGVQPRDLTPAEIKVTLGSPWIPVEDVRAFVAHLFEGTYSPSSIDVRYVEPLASWVVAAGHDITTSVPNRTTWGTARAPALHLIEDALNQRVPTVTDYDPRTERSVPNLEETVAAREKQDQIKNEFEQWLWRDPERAERLATEYNRRFNAYRRRTYDGSHLTFPGMDRSGLRGGDLAQHQKDGVWRQLQQRATLLALPVGAGKTYTMVAAAQEGRRLGLIRKALFVVPNALVEQWGDAYQRLYPTARVLVAGREHLAEGRRQEFMARSATSDHDAVIVAHSSFIKLPLRAATEQALLDRELDRLEEAVYAARETKGGEVTRTVVKMIEQSKRRLELRIATLGSRQSKDRGLRFEDLGFDCVFVDEAHAYKNLMLITKMNRVAGLPAAESARAWDMYAKTRHVLGAGGRVVFATATPCTNTLAEVFNMQRYLQEDTLERLGIAHFDAWAATFARAVTAIELAPDGSGYRSATRFASFNNAPELSLLFSQVTELRRPEDIQLERPAIRGGKPEVVVVPGSPALRAFVASLGARAEAIRSRRVEPKVDNMLLVTSDGRRAALDLREIGHAAPAGHPQKLDVLAERVTTLWREHTATRAAQVVFCDLSTPKANSTQFSFYTALREALVARGIPDSEIAFIHDAASDRDKLQLFEAVNEGRVRVVMGSTEKLGTGVNIQERLLAAHHADAPWRPADIEQRNGRILRPGNTHPEVQIFYYVTGGSFDAYMWQMQETKQHFIDQLLRGEVVQRSIEDIGAAAALTAAEAKALATGRPEIMEVVRLDSEIRRLGALHVHHEQSQRQMHFDVMYDERVLVRLDGEIRAVGADVGTARARWAAAGERSPGFIIRGTRYTGEGYRKPAGEALAAILREVVDSATKARDNQLVVQAGSYLGLDIHAGVVNDIVGGHAVFAPVVWLRGAHRYETIRPDIERLAESAIISIETRAHPRYLERELAERQQAHAAQERHLADLRRELGKPFEHGDALRDLQAKRDAIVEQLQLRDHDHDRAEVISEAPEHGSSAPLPSPLPHDPDRHHER